MTKINNLLFAMKKVCPVRCRVSIFMDSDRPEVINLQWNWKTGYHRIEIPIFEFKNIKENELLFAGRKIQEMIQQSYSAI